VAFVGTGVSISFQNAGNSTVGASVTLSFQNAGNSTVGASVTVSFQNSGGDTVAQGVSISFANASTAEGRGVSLAFGTSPPPTSPPPAATTLGGASSISPVGLTQEPVNTATGDYFSSRTDLSVPGRGIGLTFTRAYNSQDSYTGPLGANWTHSYNISLSVDGSGNVGIKQADGHTDYYAPAGGGASSTPWRRTATAPSP
jgi:hypothetical protein